MSPYLSLLKHGSVRTILLMATGSMSVVAYISSAQARAQQHATYPALTRTSAQTLALSLGGI
jgi:hypothetical protein